MAQRLATEYVHASLKITLSQLMQLMQMFSETNTEIRARVLESGSQQIALSHEGNTMLLEFVFDGGFYHAQGSFRFFDPQWTNVMHRAIRTYRGDAVVHRIYEGFTMIYHYEKGHVTKIIESSLRGEKMIYEYRDNVGKLERLFKRQTVERQIVDHHTDVNRLLDLRNRTDCPEIRRKIDEQLRELSHKLFLLEA